MWCSCVEIRRVRITHLARQHVKRAGMVAPELLSVDPAEAPTFSRRFYVTDEAIRTYGCAWGSHTYPRPVWQSTIGSWVATSRRWGDATTS